MHMRCNKWRIVICDIWRAYVLPSTLANILAIASAFLIGYCVTLLAIIIIIIEFAVCLPLSVICSLALYWFQQE
jgi:ABC-type nitrate/sulfonate/bicarbonate transport system permease component